MSKNIFRVTNSNDFQSVIEKNYLKPLFVCYINKNKNVSFYDKICQLFQQMAFQMNYCMFVIIELGEFIDNTKDNSIQSNNIFAPYFETWLRCKPVKRIFGKEGETGEGKLTMASMDRFISDIKNASTGFCNNYLDIINNCFTDLENQLQNNQNNINVNDDKVDDEEEEEEIEVEVDDDDDVELNA